VPISTFTARYPDDVAGLMYFDALAPGSAEGFLQLGPFPEPWDGWGHLERLRAFSFGSRPVVVVATQNPGQIADIRGRATIIIVAEAPQYGHAFLLQVPGLGLRGDPSCSRRGASRRAAAELCTNAVSSPR
jgi:pimeloyl-ACP methyl ester carboxylesterase